MVQLLEFTPANFKALGFGETFSTADDACKALLDSGFQFVQDIDEASFKFAFGTDPEPFYYEHAYPIMFNTYTATAVLVAPYYTGA